MQNQDKEFLGGESLFPLMTGKLPPDGEGIMSTDKKTSLLLTVLFWVTVAAMALLGGASIYFSDRFGAWARFSESLGHALIIASLLAGTVDIYVKSRLLKEASRDISKYLIGHDLPVEIQDKIHQTMRYDLIRRNLTINYTLSHIAEKPGKLLATVLYTYQVENLSNHKIDYPVRMDFAKYQNARMLEMRIDSSVDQRLNKKRRNLSPNEEQREQVSVFSLGSFKVKPNSKNHEPTYTCSIKYEIEWPVEYGDSFMFTYPTIDVTLEVEMPPSIEFFGPDEGETTSNGDRWYFRKKAFLPGETISFNWRPKPAESPSDRPD